MKFLITCLVLCGLSLGFSSQVQAQKIKDRLAQAEIYFNKGQYNQAVAELDLALGLAGKNKENLSIAWRLKGLSHLRSGEYEAAVSAYTELFKVQPDFARTAYYECGLAYLKTYQYDMALEKFQFYKNAQDKDFKMTDQTAQLSYNLTLGFDIQNCRYAREFEVNADILAEAKNLGGHVNSKADEYMPTLTADGKLLIYTSTAKGNENVMVSRQGKDSSRWTASRSIGQAINTDMNEGQARLTACGRILYFAACNWDNVAGGCDIFQAQYDRKSDALDEVKPTLGVNSDKWDSQPSISCDGQVMFFASTREGGYGGTDIWMSRLGANGQWQAPVNLGPTINTKGDEEAPFIAPDGKTLYFSSNGHPGFGDSDIFFTRLKEDNKNWTKPENLGPTINTPFREAGITIYPAGDKAYFGSAKPGGKGGLDIYEVYIPFMYRPNNSLMIEGFVFDEDNKSGIAAAEVQLGLLRGEKRKIQTDSQGYFFLCVQDSQTYSIIANKAGYSGYVGAEVLQRAENMAVYPLRIPMTTGKVPEAAPANKLQAKNPSERLRKNLSVYFESGKTELNEAQREQIRLLIEQFEGLENMKIKISGYADDEGNAEFNQRLSEKRAGLVAEYVISLGVKTENMDFDGRGINNEKALAKHQKRKVDIIILNN